MITNIKRIFFKLKKDSDGYPPDDYIRIFPDLFSAKLAARSASDSSDISDAAISSIFPSSIEFCNAFSSIRSIIALRSSGSVICSSVILRAIPKFPFSTYLGEAAVMRGKASSWPLIAHRPLATDGPLVAGRALYHRRGGCDDGVGPAGERDRAQGYYFRD